MSRSGRGTRAAEALGFWQPRVSAADRHKHGAGGVRPPMNPRRAPSSRRVAVRGADKSRRNGRCAPCGIYATTPVVDAGRCPLTGPSHRSIGSAPPHRIWARPTCRPKSAPATARQRGGKARRRGHRPHTARGRTRSASTAPREVARARAPATDPFPQHATGGRKRWMRPARPLKPTNRPAKYAECNPPLGGRPPCPSPTWLAAMYVARAPDRPRHLPH